jgi:hypothetical protein
MSRLSARLQRVAGSWTKPTLRLDLQAIGEQDRCAMAASPETATFDEAEIVATLQSLVAVSRS